MTITGTNLGTTSTATVMFGTGTGTVVSDSGTQIVATSPAGTVGSVDVTVSVSGETSATSSADQFTYMGSPVFTVNGATSTYGTATATISGTISLAPTDGSESVSVKLNGVTHTATVGSGGSFSTSFNTSTLTVAGSPYTITCTYAGDADLYPASSVAQTLTVTPATPTVTLNPVNITYGTALANSQLGGTVKWTVGGSQVSVPGTFAFTSAAGTVLKAGTGQSEAVTFSPTDTADYTSVVSTATVNVARAAATVAVNAVNITYGTALTNVQLSGTAQWTVGGNTVNVPGALAYTSAAGTVPRAGSGQSESVTFTPTDGANYTTVVATVTVNVAQVTSSVVGVNPVNITYGAALQNTQLSGTVQGTVNGQTVSIPGTFAYTSAGGTVLKAGNGQNEAVTFTPADSTDFTAATATATVNVAQATPTVVGVNSVSITYGMALANGQLSGTVQWTVGGSTVSVAGTLAYTSAAGTVLDVGNGQTEAVTFTPTDATDYATVASKAAVTVTPAPGALPANLGIFNAGYWYRDMNGDSVWDAGDGSPLVFAPAGATPVVGDWDGAPSGSGKTEIGYYLNGTWYLMTSSGSVEQFTFGFTGSDVVPVVGDWNGGGKTEVGVYANGAWFRDMDGSHTWDATNQAAVAYLGWAGASVIPVPGYWAGSGKTQMGVYCNGVWFLDSKGTGQYDGTYSYWGWSSPSSPLIPVVGNWNGGGTKSQFGVYSQGVWFRDADGTHAWDAANQAAVAYFGWAGAQPVVGDWLSYTASARPQSQPAAAAAVSDWPQAGAVAILPAATTQPQVVPERPDSTLETRSVSEGATSASEGTNLIPRWRFGLGSFPPGNSINPSAVDRIDLAAAVEDALGPAVGLRI